MTPADRGQLVARQIEIVDDRAVEVLVDHDRLTGVRTAGGHVVRRDALFVPPRFRPHDALLQRAAHGPGSDLVDDDVRRAVRDARHGLVG